MTKKAYMNPLMNVVGIQQRARILSGSIDSYGMNKRLQDEETTDDAWCRSDRRDRRNVWDEEEEEEEF